MTSKTHRAFSVMCILMLLMSGVPASLADDLGHPEFNFGFTGTAAAASQDLTTYTEHDPSGTHSVTASSISFSNYNDENNGARIYTTSNQLGVGQDATLKFNFKKTSGSGSEYFVGFGQKNTTFDDKGNGAFAGVQISSGAIYARSHHGSSHAGGFSTGQRVYVTANYDYQTSTVDVTLYEDSNRSVVLGEGSVHYNTQETHSHFFAFMARDNNDDNANAMSGDISDIDLSTTTAVSEYVDSGAEDLNVGWTEYDPGLYLDRSSNEIIFDDLRENSNVAVYTSASSKTVNEEEGTFTFDTKLSHHNQVETFVGLGTKQAYSMDALDSGAMVGIRTYGGNLYLKTQDRNTKIVGGRMGKRSYVTVTLDKAASRATATVYSDSARTNQIGQKTVAYDSNANYDYTYSFLGEGYHQNDGDIEGDVRNFKITTSTAPEEPVDSTAHDLSTFSVTGDTGRVASKTANELYMRNVRENHHVRVFTTDHTLNKQSGTLKFDYIATNADQTTAYMGVGSTELGDFFDGKNSHEFAGIEIGNGWVNARTDDRSSRVLNTAAGTRYFVTITYDYEASQMTVKMFSDMARTNQLGSKTLVYNNDVDYSHTFAYLGEGYYQSSGDWTGDVRNFKFTQQSRSADYDEPGTMDLTTFGESGGNTGRATAISPDLLRIKSAQENHHFGVYTTENAINKDDGVITFDTQITHSSQTQGYIGIADAAMSDFYDGKNSHEFAGIEIGNGWINARTQDKSTRLLNFQHGERYFFKLEYDRSESLMRVSVYNDTARSNLLATKTLIYDNDADYTHTLAYMGEGYYQASGDMDLDVRNFNVETSDGGVAFEDLDSMDLTTFKESGGNTGRASVIAPNALRIKNAQENHNFGVYTKEHAIGTQSGTYMFDVQVTHSSQTQGYIGISNVAMSDFYDGKNSNEFAGIEIGNGYFDVQTQDRATRLLNYQDGERYFFTIDYEYDTSRMTVRVYSDSERSNQLAKKSLVYDNDAGYEYTLAYIGEGYYQSSGDMDLDVRNPILLTRDRTEDYIDPSYDQLNIYTKEGSGSRISIPKTNKLHLKNIQENHGDAVYSKANAPGTSNASFQYDFQMSHVSQTAGFVGFSSSRMGGGYYDRGSRKYAMVEHGSGYINIVTSTGGTRILNYQYGERYYVTGVVDQKNDKFTVYVYNNSKRLKKYLIASKTRSIAAGASYDYTYAYLNEGYYQSSGDLQGDFSNFHVVGHRLTATSGVAGRVVSCPLQNPRCTQTNPVPGATVEVWGVVSTQLDTGDVELAREKAEEILEKASNPLSQLEEWKPDLSLLGESGLFSTTDGNYVAIHDPESWGAQGELNDPSLKNPKFRVAPGETVVLSVWNPSLGGLYEDAVDRQLPGTTQKGTIVLEQINYKGEVISSTEYKTEPRYTAFTKTHEVATVSLMRGFWRVKAKGSTTSYVIVVGDPNTIANNIESEMKNEAGEYTEQAKSIQNMLENGTMVRRSVQADSKGYFEADVPNDVNVVAVQAHKTGINMNASDVSLTELRTLVQEVGYNGSIYLSATPTQAEVPKSNVRVRMLEYEAMPYSNLTSFADRMDWVRDYLKNASFSDLPSELQQRLSDLDSTELQNYKDQYEKLLSQNDELYQKYLEELSKERGVPIEVVKEQLAAEEKTQEQLREELSAAQRTIGSLREQIEATEPPEVDLGDQDVSLSVPFDGELKKEGTMVMVHWANGTSTPMPEDYWSIESSRIGDDTVVVENFPLPADSSLARFEVLTATAEGTGSSTVRVKNPAFEGEVPTLESISLSTISPTTDEQVSLTVNPGEDSTFRSLKNATVYDPSGTALNTTLVNGRGLEFTTTSTGSYFVRLILEDAEGRTFVESFRMKATNQQVSQPPSIRIREGVTGTYALATDGLTGADVSMNGNSVTIAAVIEQGAEAPDQIQIYGDALSAAQTNLKVRLVRGTTREAVTGSRVDITFHAPLLSEDAHVYRNDDDAITMGAKTAFGERTNLADHTAITTYTDEDGSVDISINNNPGRLADLKWWFNTKLSGWDFPELGIPFTAITPDVTEIVEPITATVEPIADEIAGTVSPQTLARPASSVAVA